MSSTLEEVDGNYNITNDLEEKDSDAKCNEDEGLVNGDRGCMDHNNLNGDARDGEEESLIDKSPTKLSSPLNGIKRGRDQELKFILAEYEHTKSELSKLQTDYRLSLEREKGLCEKLQDYHVKEDSSVADLSRINEDLRKNLDTVLEELKSSNEEVKRVRGINDELEKEKSNLNAEISKLQLTEGEIEENELLKKSNQELEDKLEKTSEELTATKKKLQDHDQAAKRAIAALQKEMELRVDQEIETFWQKLKTVQAEHAKLQTAYDDRGKELAAAIRESDKFAEEVNSQAVKVKWAQSKLKTGRLADKG